MRADTIVGYTYNADTYCPLHIVAAMGVRAWFPAETDLDQLAELCGIDREDERSFDSGDFPKVIFADQAHVLEDEDEDNGVTADRCGACGELLID